ncbi:MAG: DNA internalization-related competence protein ComEC/Rec2 [Ignavibacteriales bacterium]|nr:DNA internalization-related competence protein ComEC/Rec2 [Ignavibacteriales bacterium]
MKDYPVIKFVLLFITGIIIQRFIELDAIVLVSFESLILILLIFILKKTVTERSFAASLIVVLSIIIAGCLTAELNKVDSFDFPDNLNREKDVFVIGEIKRIDLQKEYEISMLIKVDSIKFNKMFQQIDCEMYLRIRDEKLLMDSIYDVLKPGNIISAIGIFSEGKTQRNPGEFDYNNYLHSIGISGSLTTYKVSDVIIINPGVNYFDNTIHQVRRVLDSKIKSIHLPLTAGFIKGLLLADRSEIDYDTKTQFINTGVVHVLAVSGLHVGYIAMIFLILFGRFNLYLRSIFTMAGLILFMFLTNSPDSVIRAVVMSSVIIIAFISNRTTNIFNSLAIAALAILLFKPDELFSPSFQLSFGAVFGIGAVTPQITKYINSLKLKSKSIRYLFLFLAVSFGAQLGTLPMTMYYFGKLSVVAFIANLIVIPAVGVVVAIAIFTLAMSSVSLWLASFYAFVNDYLTISLFAFIKSAGELDFSFARINLFSAFNAITISVFILFVIYFWKKFNSPIAKIILLLIIFLNIFVYSQIDDKELLQKNSLNIVMIDVGQGDSFLIKFPDGKTALIDAGNADQYFDNGERVIIPLLDYLGIDVIDYGFVTHIDSDHYAGFISLIDENKIKRIFKPQLDSTLEKDVRFEKYLRQKHLPISYYHKKYLEIGGARFYILNDPTDKNYSALSTNDKSGIFKLVYGNTSFLFTGDLEADGENYFANKYSEFLDSNVLKVGHHGSMTSSSLKFLNSVKPKLSLVSAGFKNKFGHTSNKVLKRLQNSGSKILRTDLSGASILQSDGDSIKIIQWR